MADDIRENAMAGGTPARLRGLAANGNSISPTLAEVVSAMPIATHSSKGIMSADQAFYLRETTIIGGVAGGFPHRYKLIGILNYDAYAPFRVNISMGSYASTDRYLIDATLTYQKCFVSDGGNNLFCDYTDGTKSVVFGRKTTNGNFFLKNNRSTETSIVLKRIGTF